MRTVVRDHEQPRDLVTTRTVDALGRLRSTTLPTGDVVLHEIEDGGRLQRTIRPAPTPAGVISQVVELTAWGAARNVFAGPPGAEVLVGENDSHPPDARSLTSLPPAPRPAPPTTRSAA